VRKALSVAISRASSNMVRGGARPGQDVDFSLAALWLRCRSVSAQH